MNKFLYFFRAPKSVSPPLWISDNGNAGGFDGEIVGFREGTKLPPGTYWVRQIGTAKVYKKHFDYSIP